MAETRPRDVQVADIGVNTQVLRSRTWDRLRFEAEYGLQRGTTANSYLIRAEKSALIDPPGGSFTEVFLKELHDHQYFQKLDYVILGHVNPNRVETLKRLLEIAPQVTIVCSKPAANLLKTALPNQTLRLNTVRGEEVLDLGQGHELQFTFVPTPRWVDGLCTFDPATRILYTDKLFGAHRCDDALFDENWKQLDEDRHHYFDCLYAAQAKQVEDILDKLARFPAKVYGVGHGPIVRYSLSRLTLDYREWSEQRRTQESLVALLYTSAYGNTGMVAHAITHGLTQAEVAVELVDCEFADPTDVATLIERCDGCIIGSPTLGGHAPTQMQTALGLVLSTASKTKPMGVFGSYGWSGEAIDLMESKLQNAGYSFGFETIRVKFKPSEAVLQDCEAAGAEFAQVLKKAQKARLSFQAVPEATSDRTEQALGRVVGSLCILTAQQGETPIGLLTSWVSQATFNPPGITVAIAKNLAEGILDHPEQAFVLNILREGRNLRRTFLKPAAPGEDRFADLQTQTSANGCLVLSDALAYLDCQIQNRMDAGDHWLLYAIVQHGKVLEAKGVTAVQHRKSGRSY